jgi:hypothetical protein
MGGGKKLLATGGPGFAAKISIRVDYNQELKKMPDIEITPLEVLNPEGERVADQFFRQSDRARCLALVLPGLNYTCEMPLLYYATHLLLEHGCDVLQVRADYTRPEFQTLGKMEQAQRLGADSGTALQAALTARPDGGGYEQIYLLGKSIGTISMAFLLSAFPDLPHKPIWLTPLLRQPLLVEAALNWKGPAFWIASREDHTFDPAAWTRVEGTLHQQHLLLDRGNHRLEVPGDIETTLANLKSVLLTIRKFISN